MNTRLLAVALATLLSFPALANSQQPGTSTTTQASTTLSQALAALSGSTTVSDITLTGTAQRIAGSDSETGSVTYQAVSIANRLDLNLSGGTWSEIRNATSGPAGNWIGPDGSVHEIAQHNLATDPGWFPIFTISNVLSATNGVLTYVGPETKNGASVIHLQSSQQVSTDTLFQHLTQMDIYLDASTLLPVALDFNTHADSNDLLDIPVEFRFANYTSIGSLNIPFHIQKYFNGSLSLDVQFQQATLNSGLSASSSAFTIQ
jgi:hypothetical protein